MTTPLPPEAEALALAELGKRVKARTDAVKATFSQRYPDGHRETFRVDGLKLGMIYRSDPDPKWTVTDREALDKHLREFPGNLVTVYEIADEESAIDVLHNVAPHLLVEIARVNPAVVQAALDRSAAAGEPAAPGISLVKPSGVLTVKPDAQAGVAVERLVNTGRMTWDARPILEAGEVAS